MKTRTMAGLRPMKPSTKLCSRCKQEKGLEEFYTDKRHRDGKQSWCRSCCDAAVMEYQKTLTGKAVHARAITKNQQANRAKALELFGHTCSNPDCSHDLHEIAWGAHHRTPRAVSGRLKINWNWSWERIKAELSNGCELLCVPCHRATDHDALIKAFETPGAIIKANEEFEEASGF